MKTLVIAALALISTAGSALAQPNDDYTSIKKDNPATELPTSSTRKEKREERRELRRLEGPVVSYQSKEQFARDFGQVPDVTWSHSARFDEALFTQDGHTMTAYYDITSNLVGTTEVKTFEDLPAAGQQYIAKKYKDYTVDQVILYDDNENNDTDMLLFGNAFEDADNYFVELQKDNKKIVLQVDTQGLVSYFTTMQ